MWIFNSIVIILFWVILALYEKKAKDVSECSMEKNA